MDKVQEKKEVITSNFKSGEELVGFFNAYYMPSAWWMFLFGPFYTLGAREYLIAVTDRGMHLNKYGILGGRDEYEYFSWGEFQKLKLGNGTFTAPLEMEFSNGKKLKLKARLKAIVKITPLDEKTREFLLSRSM